MKFKLRLVKKEQIQVKVGPGIWEQLSGGSNVIPYGRGNFSLQDMRQAIGQVFNKTPTTRNVKIVTNQAGLDLFNKALKEQADKTLKDEYRKRFSLKSKIFKQTYKFRQ